MIIKTFISSFFRTLGRIICYLFLGSLFALILHYMGV